MGSNHIKQYLKIPGVRVVALCDVDQSILNDKVAKLASKNIKVKAYTDVRKLIEDKEIDAISIATPDHWHALITIWAIQAGKDVYVEKPVSHTVWEGQQMIKAAEKYNRIVQSGTQERSDTGMVEAVPYIQQGNLGKIQWVYGFWYNLRNSIGRVTGPQPISNNIDYDLWTGPAPLEPLRRKKLHYDWHWQWNYGTGEYGNVAVHRADLCRWVLGNPAMPKRVVSIGERYNFNDDGQTPNTQMAIYDFPQAPVICEVLNLPIRKGLNAPPVFRGGRNAIIVQCENGYFLGGRGGGWVYDSNGKKVKQFKGDGGGSHCKNFIDAVRSRKNSDLRADIRQGHLSSAMCHVANISHQLGQKSSPDTIRQAVSGCDIATESVERLFTHLKANEIDPNNNQLILGANLQIDPKTETFLSKQKHDNSWFANTMLTKKYRKGFEVPAIV